MTSKHTPGPWEIEPLCSPDDDHYPQAIIVDDGDGEVAMAHPWVGPEVREANARLIAAAPDMLRALEDGVDTLEAIANEITDFKHSARVGSLRAVIKWHRAAIAKAEGRS